MTDQVNSNTINNNKDWRVSMFGHVIQANTQGEAAEEDEENPNIKQVVPIQQALDPSRFDYIAVFIGANYCPHCKEFAPTVISSAPSLEAKRVKVIYASADRDEANFAASLKKTAGIDAMPYNLDKTKAMRDLFGLKTIPALMILKNDDFHLDTPTVVTNGRHDLVADPQAKRFPWKDSTVSTSSQSHHDHATNMSAMDRLIIRGKYGKWWELGHHANPDKPDEMYMDEHAVRARAGILNAITWIAIINVFFWREPKFVMVLFPVVAFEFLASMIFGLTPLAPIGWLGSLLAVMLYDKPHWKPARPKRFAWLIGLVLSTTCLLLFVNRAELGRAYRPLIGLTVLTCNVATWFESSCGFCLGCFVYNNYLTKWFDLEECQECKI